MEENDEENKELKEEAKVEENDEENKAAKTDDPSFESIHKNSSDSPEHFNN